MDLLNSIENQLTVIGGVVAVIGMVCLGIVLIFKSIFSKNGMRDAFSGIGGIFAGIMLIGAGTAIVGAIMSIAESL